MRWLRVSVEFTVYVGMKQALYSTENMAVSSGDKYEVSKSANLLEPKAFAPLHVLSNSKENTQVMRT